MQIIDDDRLFELEEPEAIIIENIIRSRIQETSSVRHKLPPAGNGLCKWLMQEPINKLSTWITQSQLLGNKQTAKEDNMRTLRTIEI